MTFRIALLVFPGFDLIDMGGPYEVFLTAARLQERAGLTPDFEVLLVSPGGQDVAASGGMQLTGLLSPADAGAVDVVVVPGTIDVGSALANQSLLDAVTELADNADLVTSVCTGSFLLANAGLLTDLPATTHWEDVQELATANVGEALGGRRWVDAGSVVTSGGLTSGIHMALHLVGRLVSSELASATARQLDMDFDPSGARTV
jgi:transcriptional regulator GlxA family with amidase domain